jgi:hypothetical protein
MVSTIKSGQPGGHRVRTALAALGMGLALAGAAVIPANAEGRHGGGGYHGGGEYHGGGYHGGWGGYHGGWYGPGYGVYAPYYYPPRVYYPYAYPYYYPGSYGVVIR